MEVCLIRGLTVYPFLLACLEYGITTSQCTNPGALTALFLLWQLQKEYVCTLDICDYRMFLIYQLVHVTLKMICLPCPCYNNLEDRSFL